MEKNVKKVGMPLYWMVWFIVMASMAFGENKMTDYPIHVKDLHIRDPFVLPIAKEKTYYMYASGKAEGGSPPNGLRRVHPHAGRTVSRSISV